MPPSQGQRCPLSLYRGQKAKIDAVSPQNHLQPRKNACSLAEKRGTETVSN
ncbi:hypothetical protein GCWU000246_00587 [Jonquetella anthropi E3_33 E1]|nr:hypothetical protein GCWU000246_00587 [Jonquetella anthropi E3_33 E1]